MDHANILPYSWLTVSVSDVGISVTGNTPPTKDQRNYGSYLPYIKPPQLDNCLINSSEEFLSEKGALLARVLPANSVLVSCIGNLGRTALNTVPVAFNQQINAIIPFDGVSAKFLFYQVQSHWFRSQLESKATATTISIVNKGNFETVLLNLAPTNEQYRIVAKIEALFSELDKGIESFRTAREQLKIYRQTLLKHAFSGKLTEQWRTENADGLESAETLLQRIQTERQQRYQQQLKDWEASGKQGSKPKAPKTLPPLTPEELTELLELPKSWIWHRLGLSTCSVEYGTSAKSSEIGVCPVLRMGNIQNGKFDWGDLVFTSDQTEIDKYLLHKNDVLFNRTNSPELVGKTAIYKAEMPAIFAGYLIRVNQIDSIVIAEYMNYFLNSHTAKQHGNKVKTDGVNQSNINGEKLVNYPFPFCSINEQLAIIDLLESGLSKIDQLDQTLTIALQKAEALRQSILKKAFSGQLVPQDPNDEPASVLLERIQAEKAAQALQTKPKKTPKRKATA
jgi:type I restriction enzyme S subunit